MTVSSKENITSSSPLKVLVADDDVPTRMLLRAAISQWGYEVIEAKDGEEAWALLQTEDAPRLLILDWLMPKLDGVKLCGRSREELNFHPYIILLTQVTGITNLIKGLEAGADEFLSKPFNMAELKSRLSIGARIIKNEHELANQNQDMINKLNLMDGLADKALKNIATVQQVCGQRQDNPCTEEISQLMQEFTEMRKLLLQLRGETK